MILRTFVIVFIWIMIRYFLSECQDNVNSFNNNRANIELESEANPYHPNEGTYRINSLGRF